MQVAHERSAAAPGPDDALASSPLVGTAAPESAGLPAGEAQAGGQPGEPGATGGSEPAQRAPPALFDACLGTRVRLLCASRYLQAHHTVA